MDEKKNIQVLLVEDSPVQSAAISIYLRKSGYTVETAKDGEEGLLKLGNHPPDILLTDLNMPGLDGMELLRTVRSKFAKVPVILMTGDGNDAIATEALKNGAASYIAKDQSMAALLDTIARITAATTSADSFGDLLNSIEHCQYTFNLRSDRTLIVSLVQYVQYLAGRAGLTDVDDRRNLGVAFEEALLNAMYHGSLEVPRAFRECETEERDAIVKERRQAAPYRDRRIQVTVEISEAAVTMIIRDEGPGFDFESCFSKEGTDEGSFVITDGMRGLILMNTFMDEVEFSPRGNEVRMLKRLQQG